VLNIVVLFYRDPTWSRIPHTEALALGEVVTRVPRPAPEAAVETEA
jgi:hypothetical protein